MSRISIRTVYKTKFLTYNVIAVSFPFYISKKYTLSKKGSRFTSFISSIAILGIALGVAALIIALSILNGFEKTITDKVIDFDSHIQVTSYTNILPNYQAVLPGLRHSTRESAVSIDPYFIGLSIIGSKYGKEGVSIKGITSDSKLLIRQNLVEGIADLWDSTANSIVIGRKIANKLFLKTGDNVTLFALNQNEAPSPENPPNIMRFKVIGIFESGMAEYDDLYAYTSLSGAQSLFNVADNINGYDIRVKNVGDIDSLAAYLAKTLKYPHSVTSIYQLHRNIFTWIELQKEPIPIILGLIILVAALNIIGTLLMIVLEKTNAIGTLKAMGAGKRQIVMIFLYQGMYLGLIGIILGNLLSFLLLFIQMEYNIITIPASVYFMSTVPILLSAKVFAGVSVVTFILCILVSVVPSFIAAAVKPVSSLRFN